MRERRKRYQITDPKKRRQKKEKQNGKPIRHIETKTVGQEDFINGSEYGCVMELVPSSKLKRYG